MAAAASGEQLLAWVRAALAHAEARTGLHGFVAVKGRQTLMAKCLGHSVAQLLSMAQELVGKAYNSSPVLRNARTRALGDCFVVDDVAFSVVNQTDHGGVTWACWCKNLELPTRKHPATHLHYFLGGRTGAATNAGSAASAEAAPRGRPAADPGSAAASHPPAAKKAKTSAPSSTAKTQPNLVFQERAGFEASRGGKCSFCCPTPCPSSHARRPAADSPHTPKTLKPLPWVFASPRRASQSQLRRLPMNRAVPLRRVGLTARFASRAWSTNTRVHETCTSACGAATVARDCA